MDLARSRRLILQREHVARASLSLAQMPVRPRVDQLGRTKIAGSKHRALHDRIDSGPDSGVGGSCCLNCITEPREIATGDGRERSAVSSSVIPSAK